MAQDAHVCCKAAQPPAPVRDGFTVLNYRWEWVNAGKQDVGLLATGGTLNSLNGPCG